MSWTDKIPGGLADEKVPKQFDSKQLEEGIKVELEHTDDRDVAKEIAMDHLIEDKDYYKKLKTIETRAKKKSKKKKRVDLDIKPYPNPIHTNYDYTAEGPNETSTVGSPYHGTPGSGEKSMGDWIKKRRKELNKRRRKLEAFTANIRINEFLKLAQESTMYLPAGTKLYHGTIQPQAEQIAEQGMLRGDMWSNRQQGGKTSGGTMDEEGLIWFFLENNLDIAHSYARGQEAPRRVWNDEKGDWEEREVLPGKVFVVTLPRSVLLAERYKELSEDDAKKLAAINKRQHYDPIVPGDKLNSAVRNLMQWSEDPKTYKDILPMLGYDGIIYYGGLDVPQIGILANALPISEMYDAEPSKPQEPMKQEMQQETVQETPTEQTSSSEEVDEIMKLLSLK